MKHAKRSGDKTLPCGLAMWSGTADDKQLPTVTFCVWPWRKLPTSLHAVLERAKRFLSLIRSKSWDIESKAFEKSISTATENHPFWWLGGSHHAVRLSEAGLKRR
jgi:hypothetical protein